MAAMTNKKPKILLIDDEQDILDTVSFLFRREGYELTCANSAVLGLTLLTAQKFDLVVCDYLMPQMDGLQLLKQVRQKNDYTPFIFFSGHAEHSHEVSMVGMGAYELIHKPDITKLAHSVKRILKELDHVQSFNELKSEEAQDFLKLLHSSGN